MLPPLLGADPKRPQRMQNTHNAFSRLPLEGVGHEGGM